MSPRVLICEHAQYNIRSFFHSEGQEYSREAYELLNAGLKAQALYDYQAGKYSNMLPF